MNNVLLIDDRIDFVDSFKVEAKSQGISIVARRSFEGLQSFIPKLSHKFAAVILDINCLLTDDQELENSDFIGEALTYLNQVAPKLPRFIFTGDDTEFEKLGRYFKNEKIYQKTSKGLDQLFIDLGECIQNSEILKIVSANESVFEILKNNSYSDEDEKTLIGILENDVDSFTQAEYKKHLVAIRGFQEVIYKRINSKSKNVVPDKIFKSNGMIKFGELMKHLSGYPNKKYIATKTVYQNGAIYNYANSLYWTCGEYIHEDPNREYFISSNALKANTYSLLELIIWSSKYL